MSEPFLRPLSFGDILDGAFSLYRRHFLVLFVSALIPLIPISFLSWTLEQSALAPDPEASGAETMFAVLLLVPLAAVAVPLLWAALTRQFAQAMRGGEVSLPDGYRMGARSILPLLGAGVLVVVAVAVLMLVASMVAAALIATAGLAGAVVTFVLIMLIMLVAFATLFAVVPAVVLEGKGPVRALQRSWELARGAWPRILGVMIVSWLITMLPIIGVAMVAGTGAAMFDPAQAAALSRGQVFVQQMAGLLSGALTFPFLVGCLVLLYYDRRVRTEAYDLELAVEGLAPVN